jgi:hypothetical protein
MTKLIIKTSSTSQTALRNFNADLINTVSDLNWEEATEICGLHSNLDKTTKYRNMLLESLDGKELHVKGILVNQTNPLNFTVGNAAIYYNGAFIDTIQHISIYADLLSKDSMVIGGWSTPGKGQYSLNKISRILEDNMLDNIPYVECQAVEFTGISYSYRGKWSIGTERQVGYALDN